MAAALWVLLDEQGIWVGPEMTAQRTVIADVVKEIDITALTFKVPKPIFLADPAIARVDHQTGKSDQQAYAEAGLLTRPGNNDWRPSVNAIKSLLAADRLHIAAGCEVLIDQLGKYRWRSTGRSEHAAPEGPVKRDDHTVDALRYAIMALPIPEVVGAPDTRSKMERLLAQDVARAKHASGEEPTEYGSGFWD
jgi:Terminase-like family.